MKFVLKVCLLLTLALFWSTWADVLLHYPLNGAASIICPQNTTENSTECITTHTCCQAVDGWGCCPYSDAVCCDDKEHCCPSGYVCEADRQSKYYPCVKRVVGGEDKPLEDPLTNEGEPKEWLPGQLCAENIVCPGQFSTCCPSNSTSEGYLCCPAPNGVCCGDGQYCCSSQDAGCAAEDYSLCALKEGGLSVAYKTHSCYDYNT